MKGSYQITIQNKRVRYDFTIRRNITVLRGESATGKTQLIEMLSLYNERQEESGIQVRSDVPCIVLTEARWETNLRSITGSIIFIDEGSRFSVSKEFAEAIRGSDNYYVIITRDRLVNLPYSAKEVYGIRVSGKYRGLRQTYNEFYPLYPEEDNTSVLEHPQFVVEDTNAGFDFFHFLCARISGICSTAGGKSGFAPFIHKNGKKPVMVIADGAAFGCEIGQIHQLMLDGYPIGLYLPESFEWLILRANLLKDAEVREILHSPEEYADSKDYFSWEQFFTRILVQKTVRTYLKYSKDKLNESYLQPKIIRQIVSGLPEQMKELLEWDEE